ncbi:MAG: (2Fe-2S) ferredoxin domain-containing protein, partial [Thermococcus sp.]|nr:(2Fe-2S) ferredoxin domain-containing protein [Thermococcus sp.]
MSEIKAIAVGMNSCGIAAGARETYAAIKAELEKRNLDIKLKIVGCVGMCYREPLVDIITDEEIITYGHVDPKKVPRIIEEHVINGKPI